MSLIERYIAAATENLKDNMKEDVAEELRSNIADMLPENPTEEDIKKVLEDLGDPRKLAREYSNSKRYLIGPALYDSYVSVLKLVVSIVTITTLFITLLSMVFENPGDINTSTIAVELVKSLFAAALQAAFWVTIVFTIMERSNINEGKHPFNRKWTVKDLPSERLSNKSRISKTQVVFEIFVTVLFTSALCFKPEVIAIYFKSKSISDMISVLSIEHLKNYIPVIIAIAVVQIGVSAWKFISGRWTMPLVITAALQSVAACILVVKMFNDKLLFNNMFFVKTSELFKVSEVQFRDGWFMGMAAFSILFIVVNVWEIIDSIKRCR